MNIEKTNIDQTDEITYQINKGECKQTNQKNMNTQTSDQDFMLNDLNSKLKGLDDIKNNIKQLEDYSTEHNQRKSDLQKSITSSQNCPTSKDGYEFGSLGKIWDTKIPISPATNLVGDMMRLDESEIMMTNPREGRYDANMDNSSARLSNTMHSADKWWNEVNLRVNDENIYDCLDDIDKEFEEIEKMIAETNYNEDMP